LKFQISNLRLRRATACRRLPSAPASCSCLLLLLFTFCLLPSAQAAWVRQKSGSFAWLHSVFFVGERGWAVGGKGALLETADGGESWQLLRPPTDDALQDVFFTDERTGFIVCVRSVYSPMKVGEPRSYLLKTTDGGDTWTRVDVVGAGEDSLQLARVRFADARRGWVFGEEGALYSTEDGGATWARLRLPTRHLLLGAQLSDARRGWLVGAGRTLLQTSDGGVTWREGQLLGLPARNSSAPQPTRAQSTPASAQLTGASPQSQPSSAAARAAQAQASSLRLNAVSFADARHGWAVGANGAVLATTDGGRTWGAQESGIDSDLFDVKFFDAREGWAVGSDGAAIHTTDGGQSWRAEQTGTTHALERLCFEGRARGWAVGFGGTIIAFKE
jgi:photosystem II stability/assembly factor-like uncharacterized protein